MGNKNLVSIFESFKDCKTKGVFFISSGDQTSFLTYDELYQKSATRCAKLYNLGLKRNDNLIISLADEKDFLISFWACIYAGIIAVPISPIENTRNTEKLLNIWKQLIDPYLVCDKIDFESHKLKKGNEKIFKEIRTRSITSIELDKSSKVKKKNSSFLTSDQEIAYIQFSSGSTGNPKGVVLTHQNLMVNIMDITSRSEIKSSDKMLSWMPLTHDMGLICFHLSASYNSCNQFVLPTNLFIRRPLLWLEKSSEYAISILFSPNFGYHYFLTAVQNLSKSTNLSSIRLIYNGAEPISYLIYMDFLDKLSPFGLKDDVIFPGYGLAEASVAVTLPILGKRLSILQLNRESLQPGRVVKEDENGHYVFGVGHPVDHCSVRVVDSTNNPVKEKIVGDIQIKGLNVTAGYYGTNDTSKGLFSKDGWLITGDLGFFKDGELFVTGRVKNIIIINGQNYYPNDIENHCLNIEGIDHGKIVACDLNSVKASDNGLCLFVLFKGKPKDFATLSQKIVNTLRNELGFVPKVIVPVRRIPKTTSGKIQNFKLLEQYSKGDFDDVIAESNKYISQNPPRENTQTRLMLLVKKIFGFEIGSTKDFLSQGITSLQLVHFSSEIWNVFGVSLDPAHLFEYNDLKKLADQIDIAKSTLPKAESTILQDDLKLTSGEKRLWLMSQITDKSNALNLNCVQEISGKLNVEAFANAFRLIVRKHHNLRVRIIDQGGIPHKKVMTFEKCEYEFQIHDSKNKIFDLDLELRKINDASFDLEKNSLIRTNLYRVARDKYYFIFSIHHLIFDGWSFGILLQDLSQFYNRQLGKTTPNIETSLFPNIMLDNRSRSRDYWLEELKRARPFPTGSMQNPNFRRDGLKGIGSKKLTLSDQEFDKMKSACQEMGVSPFMYLVASVILTIHKFSGNSNICCFSSAATKERHFKKHIIGYFLDTVLLRLDINENDSLHDLLLKAKAKVTEGLRHSSYSLDQVIEDISIKDQKTHLSTIDILEVLVLYQNFEHGFELSGFSEEIEVRPIHVNPSSILSKIQFEFIESHGELQMNVTYDKAYYEDYVVEQFVESLQKVIYLMHTNTQILVKDVDLLSTSCRKRILTYSNLYYKKSPGNFSLIELFEKNALHIPEKVALTIDNKMWTYTELNSIVNGLANLLINKYSIGANDRVGLLVDRSEWVIIGVLAILKTGAAYVPIDPDYPVYRIRSIIDDCQPKLILTNSNILHTVLEDSTINILKINEVDWSTQLNVNPGVIYNRKNLAYVIYTSGTTGGPKGIMIEYESLNNYVEYFSKYFCLSEGDSVIQQTSMAFDTFVEEAFPILTIGGTIHGTINGGRDVDCLIEVISSSKATILSATPTLINELDKRANEVNSLRILISGGETLKPNHIKSLIRKVKIFNTYGPTETTVCATYYQVTDPIDASTLGSPVEYSSVLVLNEQDEIVPEGIVGEILISGPGVGRGYLNNPELTDQRFINSTFEGGGSKIYRTGDLGRWNQEGFLEYVGRVDDQTKINGYRIELEEIERTIIASGMVEEVVVLSNKNESNNNELVVYLVPKRKYAKSRLLEYLNDTLPVYMIPYYYVELSSLPRNINGKLDRKALLDYSYASDVGIVEPKNQIECSVRKIWSQVLELPEEKISCESDFFELGGHSLKIAMIASRIRSAFGAEISVRDVFVNRTVVNISKLIRKLTNENQLDDTSLLPHSVTRSQLSFGQESMYFLHKLEGSSHYHLPLILELSGEVNFDYLETTISEIINRHEVLRTVFKEENGIPFQHVLPKDFWRIQYFDMQASSSEESNLISDLIYREFDLSTEIMLRTCLIKQSKKRHLLVLVAHHIAFDGWSYPIVIGELSKIYTAKHEKKEPQLLEQSMRYIDFAIWQRSHLTKDSLKSKLYYWEEKLKGAVPLNLPTDFPRQLEQRYNGKSTKICLDKKITDKLKRLSLELDASLFMTLLASLYVLLYRYGGQKDICVGTPIAGRNRLETESIVGYFINTLLMRDTLQDDFNFVDLLISVKNTVLEAFDHQDVPYEKVVEQLRNAKHTSHLPLLQVMFVLQSNEIVSFQDILPELKVNKVDHVNQRSKFDLTFLCQPVKDALELEIEYRIDLFQTSTVERMAKHFVEILKSISENPYGKIDSISILSAKEKNRLLYQFDSTKISYPQEKSVISFFEEHVKRTPNAIAVVFNETRLSYQDLALKVNQLAFSLREEGLERNHIAGLLFNRSIETIVGLLGIIKAGGAYLPIDADYPEGRIRYLIDDSQCYLLLSSKSLAGDLNYHEKTIFIEEVVKTDVEFKNLEPISEPEDLCYVIYTSGTTGNPKGVLVEHRNLVRLFFTEQPIFDFNSHDVWTMFHSPSFDFSVWEIFGALLFGGKLVIVPKLTVRDSGLFMKLLETEQVTVLNQTPSAFYNLILQQQLESSVKLALRYVIFGGEALRPSRLQEWKLLYPDTKLINMFGITETTVHVTYKEITNIDISKDSKGIGIPLPTLSVLLLDKSHQLVPQGAVGELCVGGTGVSRGYLNNELLTEERFIPNPYNPKERLYCSGDWGRIGSNGELEFLGRKDDQVKIRGYRIELGEVESQLSSHDNIEQSVVLARGNEGDKYLVGYYVASEEIDSSDLRNHLLNRLPEYMVPSFFVLIQSLPLTPSGKIDRKALPDPEVGLDQDFVEPSNEIEEKLTEIWAEVLQINKEQISVTKSFFELGGHSLKAMILVNQLSKHFEVEVPLREVFLYQDIQSFASYLPTQEKSTHLSIPVADNKPLYTLSSSQRRLYFLYEFEADSLAYNMPMFLRLEGELDVSHLEQCIRTLISQHESLRTRFIMEDGEIFQKVEEKVDFELIRQTCKESELKEVLENFVKPFELSHAPVLRVGLIHLSTSSHILAIDMHHIITDGVSEGVLAEDFMSLYKGEKLSKPRLTYKDYAEWQQSIEYKKQIKKAKEFWINNFSEELSIIDLPTDYPRPSSPTYSGGSKGFILSEKETEKLRSLGESVGATTYMTFLSLVNVLLSKLSGQEDIVIGTPVAGREHSDLESMVGMFVNTLPLRNYPEGDKKFKEFLIEVKERTLSSFEHQSYPYEELLEELDISRDTSHNPLFDVMVDFDNYELVELEIPGLKLSPYEKNHDTSKFDLTFSISENEGSLNVDIEYSTDLFKPNTIERFIAYFKHLVEEIIENPNRRIAELDIISDTEKKKLLYEFNNTKVDYPLEKTVIDLFEEQVSKSPSHIALEVGLKKITYEELDEKANQFADFLISDHAIEIGDIVGISMQRNENLIIAILGILKCGAAYLPVDPSYPEKRIQYIIQDSNLKILLHDGTNMSDFVIEKALLVKNVLFRKRKRKFVSRGNSKNPLYVIYTSGSTGQPKGVMVRNNSFINLLTWYGNTLEINEKDVMLLVASISFDLAQKNMFIPLIHGACLSLSEESTKDYSEMIKLIQRSKVTIINCAPSAFYPLLDHDINKDYFNLKSLKKVVLGGEPINLNAFTGWKTSGYFNASIINSYGPTECTDVVSFFELEVKDFDEHLNLPIGKPICNVDIYVTNGINQLVPLGVSGEICISGDCVSMGYVGSTQLNLKKFVPNPFKKGSLMYKTGDIGRWLEDGNIEFLGRKDDQVKIRGYRIELGEVESQLSSHDNIEQSVVLARGNEGDKYLVGYYVASEEIDSSDLRNHLLNRLPEYMVPSFFVLIQSLPLTPSGKIDRKALPDPEVSLDQEFVGPQTPIQELLCSVWSSVLGVDRIGIKDNYFSIGGDSIRSIQISSRIRSAGYQVSVRDLFTYQTIEELSKMVKKITHVSDQSEIVGKVALTGIQQLFFNQEKRFRHHYNQAVMLNFPDGITEGEVEAIFTKIQSHHDALRMCYQEKKGEVVQKNQSSDLPLWLKEEDLRSSKNPSLKLLELCNKIQSSIDLKSGPLMHLGLFHLNDGSRLLIAIHHLVVDGVSWRILFEDIELLYQQHRKQQPLHLPLKTDSFQYWAKELKNYMNSKEYAQSMEFWKQFTQRSYVSTIPSKQQGSNKNKDVVYGKLQLSKSQTTKLLNKVHGTFNTQINDILLAGLLLGVQRYFGQTQLKLDLEGHGREAVLPGINIDRTIGWFTSIFPVLLEQKVTKGLSGLIKEVKEILRAIPHNGIDYLPGLYLTKDITNSTSDHPTISFNYLGQFDSDTDGKVFQIASESAGDDTALDDLREYDWDISGMISEGKLVLALAYSKSQYPKDTIKGLMDSYQSSLVEIIDHCSSYQKQELTPSDLTYKGLRIEDLEALQEKYDIEDIYRLSPMQEGILFHALLDVEGDQYFEQVSYRLEGNFNIHSTEKAYQKLIDRHAILRTNFLHEGYDEPLQIVSKTRKVSLFYKDIRDELDQAKREEVVEKYRLKDREQKFNLINEVLIRVSVFQTGENEYEFIWSSHHILMDGWCVGILINEFNDLYNCFSSGTDPKLSNTIPYSRYIEWIETVDKEESLQYWRQYLAGYDSLATLSDQSTLLSDQKKDFGKSKLVLDRKRTGALQELSRKQAVTLNTIIQSIWGILLSRYNNTEDVVFGAVVSGRPATVEGIEEMIGLFINTVPVRIRYDEKTSIHELFELHQHEALESETHHYSPLSDVQSQSELGRDLLDHILVFQNYPEIEKMGNGINEDYEISNLYSFEQTNYDLTVVIQTGEEIIIELDYNLDAFDPSMIDRLKDHLDCLISSIIENPNRRIAELDIISDTERKKLLYEFNNTKVDYPLEKTVIDLFEEQVSKNPDQTALTHNGITLTYRDLNSRSNQLAVLLGDCSISKNDVVGVMVDRSFEMVISLLGILKSGGAYLPIDPEYPTDRINFMLEDSRVNVLIIDNQNISKADRFPGKKINAQKLKWEKMDKAYPPIKTELDDLLYVIYTSGSTGKPKGAMLSHRNLVNLIYFDHENTNIDFSTVLQFTTLSFDPSFREIFSTLLKGGQVVLVDREDLLDAPKLLSTMEENRVTTLFMPGSLINQYFNTSEFSSIIPKSIRHIVSAGEQTVVGETLMNYLKESGVYLHNHYGPSETHVVTGLTLDPTKPLPQLPNIGKPVPNTSIYILDENLQIQPLGIAGELYVGGVQVGLGYLNNKQLTAERFIENPFKKGERLYRTGDICRWLEDGNIEFLGRKDDQVKIRGYRIELGEVESQLSSHDNIEQSVVLARGNEGDKYLVGYYVASEEIDSSDLRNHLLNRLPEYMVPSFFVLIQSLPLTPSGKIDRKALPDPEVGLDQDFVEPSNEIEEKLTEIWAEVLQINKEQISVTKSFFELGGHSLKATNLVSLILKEYQVKIPLKDIFLKSTILDQSSLIMILTDSDHASDSSIIEIKI